MKLTCAFLHEGTLFGQNGPTFLAKRNFFSEIHMLVMKKEAPGLE